MHAIFLLFHPSPYLVLSPPLPVQHVLIHQHGTPRLGPHQHPSVCCRVKEQSLGIVVPVQRGGEREGSHRIERVRGGGEGRLHRENGTLLPLWTNITPPHHPHLGQLELRYSSRLKKSGFPGS